MTVVFPLDRPAVHIALAVRGHEGIAVEVDEQPLLAPHADGGAS